MVYSEDRSTQKDTSSSAVTSSLSDLIARLEKATGPDRELDALITLFVRTDCTMDWSGWIWRDGRRLQHVEHFSNPYTSSIDAAITLVPEGMEKDFTDLYGVARVSVGINAEPGPFYGTHEGGSLAIALCIAALRARSQIEPPPANDSAETMLEI